MKSFQEKLQALRSRHTKWDPEAKKQIDAWERRMAELQVDKDWLLHPTTCELAHIAKGQIENIEYELSRNAKLTEDERRTLFSEREAHLTYLAVLTTDPSDEMAVIEAAVNQEL